MAKSVISSSPSFWRSFSVFLIALIFAQWFLFIGVLERSRQSVDTKCVLSSFCSLQDTMAGRNSNIYGINNFSPLLGSPTNNTSNSQGSNSREIIPRIQHGPPYDGVAVTVMLRAPKWFHRRYTVMLQNALANIPPTWPIQIFSNEDWLKRDVLPLHPGLQRLRSHSRIIWTALPTDMTKKKPKEIMKSDWLWEQIVAENVLLFSGNGAFCANSRNKVEDFLKFDYIGVPWGNHHGLGGDGSSHSFRHRSAMMRILKEHPPTSEMDSQDYHYFAKYLVNDPMSKIADPPMTYSFGGVSDLEDAPLLLSGTQASLNWTSRESLLSVCPELKVIFPSLHEPSCFGAHPNGEKCKMSICALQDKIPPSGC